MTRIRHQQVWLQLGDLGVPVMFPVFVEETDETKSPQEVAA